MLANWIKQTGVATGTGSITVAVATGYPAFYDRFGLNRHFQYDVLNTDGTPISSEIGYLSDSTTLVRVKALETMISGVLTTAGASIPALSGEYQVIAGIDAGMLATTMSSVMSGGGGFAKRICSMPIFNFPATNTSVSINSNVLHYFPVYVGTANTINSLIADIITPLAGSSFRIGIYSFAADGSIGNLIVDSGDMSGATATLVSASITPLRLPPGWYWGAIVTTGTVAFRGTQVFGDTPLGWDTGTARYKRVFIQQAFNYGALPSVPPFSAPTYLSTAGINAYLTIWMGLTP